MTPRIRTLELVAVDGGELPRFTAGSHIDVELGNGEERSYSLLNDPEETHRYCIAVLREAAGRGGSAWMHDVLREGDVLRASEPSNNFRLSEAGEHHILIAGGIGITPILSMAARLKRLGRHYAVHYCARSAEEAAFAAEIAAEHGERVRFHYDGGDPTRGLDLVSLLKDRPTAAHAYVCGPAGLIRATREAGRDWPMGTVHYELFKGSEADIATRKSDEPFDIVLRRTNATLHVPADRSVLDVLKGNGFRIKSLCREGVCGTCRVRVLSGKVEHRDDCLDDEDREEVMQACVSRAMPGETLVLDL
ncbi:PDR/VanB family oxidoreductase [Roseomonas sp. BN140053]|uniref:PDR/VanB family oxidoreductase n=1 Tax=Roseomonas sp. BN140053 TaxID=3391898 RepID=UPI0039EB4ACE